MSATQLMAGTSTSAVITEVTGKLVKVEYLDAMARPDLVGKSVWLMDDSGKHREINDIIVVAFEPSKDRRFNVANYKPYIRSY